MDQSDQQDTKSAGSRLGHAVSRRLRLLHKAIVVELWVNTVLASRFLPERARHFFLRLWGVPIGKGTSIRPGCRLGSKRLSIGSGCKIERIEYDGDAGLEIGDNSFVGRGVMVVTRTHPLGGPERRRGQGDIDRPVKIGRGCWIPQNAVISPGVEIADGCVVLSGAVVTASTQPNGLYGGVPAVRIRDLGE